jgi:hypothetical protein
MYARIADALKAKGLGALKPYYKNQLQLNTSTRA